MFRHLKFLIFWIVILAVVPFIVMLLWNILIPSILGLSAISYWQALGLFVLCRILFGGFRFGGGRPHGFHHMGDNPIHEKWKNMTDQERREFIEKRRRFGFGGPFGKGRFNMDDFSDETKDEK